MKFTFYKYHGTGNDFILIDNRTSILSPNDTLLIQNLCHRRFGIGADGLMLLENADGYDFRMRYFNSDGKEGTMCGNGGRCIVAFAKFLNIITDKANFIAVDGSHKANITISNGVPIVSLKMADVSQIEQHDKQFFLDTGSPHFVQFINSHNSFDTYTEGKKIRYSERFKAQGTNVNFVSFNNDNSIQVSTYERGVEAETYSCGTGVVASAICTGILNNKTKFNITTKGGNLKVTFNRQQQSVTDIWLTGSAVCVFEGIFTK